MEFCSFGTQDIPIISLDQKYMRKFDLLLEVILDELQTRDNIQGEMLQMLLKRWIIICTRLAKEQLIMKSLNDKQIDVIRQYNFLVDMHFRGKKESKRLCRNVTQITQNPVQSIFHLQPKKSAANYSGTRRPGGKTPAPFHGQTNSGDRL